MHLSKKIDLELRQAKGAGDIKKYVKIRQRRNQISPFDKYRIRLMGDIMQKESMGIVLDAGCNIGSMMKFYDRRSSAVVLCDIDQFVVKGAEFANACHAKLNFVSGNMKNLPFKNGYFDTIVTLETIEHLYQQEQAQALREILRVAKSDATIYISTPNRFSPAGLEGKIIELFLRNYKWDAWDDDHKCVYYSWGFIGFLKGFSEQIEIKKIYGSYFLPGSLTIRLPLWLQNCLGFLSYLIARFAGHLFPFRYIGFTTIVVVKKKK